MTKADLKNKARGILDPILSVLDGLGVSPMLVSLFGLVFSLYAAYVVAKGSLFAGGVWLLIGGLCDVLDGGLARRRGEESRFGAFIDSTLDRVSELALFGGIVIYYTSRSVDYSTLTVVLVLVAMGSSMLISYARARLEGLGYTCFVGWFERPERMAIMVVGLMLGHVMLTLAIVVLAFGATWTVIQRIRHAYVVTRPEPPTATKEQSQSHPQ